MWHRADMRQRLGGRLRLVLIVLPALAVAAALVVHAPAARAGGSSPILHWDSQMIYPGQNNDNPEGPVGMRAIVHGANFNSSTSETGYVLTFAVIPGDVNNSGGSYEFCKLGQKVSLPGTATVSGSGTFDYAFNWPARASSGSWSICAYEQDGFPAPTGIGSIDDGPFLVLSPNPISISVSPPSISPGGGVTVTGQSFVPAQQVSVIIASCADCGAQPLATASAQSAANGSFSVDIPIPDTATSGTYVVNAIAAQGLLDNNTNGNGAQSLFVIGSAQATIAITPNVTVASATPTTTATSTGGGGSTTTGGSQSSNLGLIIGLAVAIIALLALIAGLITYLALKRGNAAKGQPGGPGQGIPVAAGGGTIPPGQYVPPTTIPPYSAPYYGGAHTVPSMPDQTPAPTSGRDPAATSNAQGIPGAGGHPGYPNYPGYDPDAPTIQNNLPPDDDPYFP